MNSKLKTFMFTYGISQKDVSDLSDLSQDQMNRIVNDKRPATITEAAMILAAIRAIRADDSIRLDSLFDIEREPEVEAPSGFTGSRHE